MKKIFGVIILSLLVLAGCGAGGSTENIVVTGSTSVEKYFTEVIKPQAEKELGITLEYNAQGSSAAVEAVSAKTASFGTLSRATKDEEQSKFSNEITLGYDGIAVALNDANPVTNLTLDQVRDIYTGKITNWSEVGGTDSKIVVVSRENGSGTRSAFEEIVGYGEDSSESLVSTAEISNGNGTVASTVAGNENAIGYVSFEAIETTQGAKSVQIDGVDATPAKVANEEYKLARPFIMIYDEQNLTEKGKELAAWLAENSATLAPEGGLIAKN